MTLNLDQYDQAELTPAQQAAVDDAVAGKSIFISGPGGTGKSLVTKVIVDALTSNYRHVVVTGSTGMAAVNVNGMTIHSLLGTGIANNIKAAKESMSSASISKAQDRLASVSAIVIDEISMLTGDYLDMMDWWLNLVNGNRKPVPFGGYQIIFVGDALQLPPVTQSSDIINRKYAFQAEAWERLDPQVHLLMHNFRQDGNDDFKRHLMRLRRGQSPQDTLDYFNARVGAKFPEGIIPTKIFPTNREVDAVNTRELNKLTTPLYETSADFAGHPKWIEGLKKSMPCMDILSLKVGAEVMTIRNHREGVYVNGSRGVVTSCDRYGIHVRLRDGSDVEISRIKWENKDAKGVTLASVDQFPLKLAWACTAHKVQGATLDEIEFDPTTTFEKAMAYVAISRVRSYEGLALSAPLRSAHVKASKIVVEWYKEQRAKLAERAASGQA